MKTGSFKRVLGKGYLEMKKRCVCVCVERGASQKAQMAGTFVGMTCEQQNYFFPNENGSVIPYWFGLEW